MYFLEEIHCVHLVLPVSALVQCYLLSHMETLRGHILGNDWLPLSQQLVSSHSPARGRAHDSLPPPCWVYLSVLSLQRSCTCCLSFWVFIRVTACHAREAPFPVVTHFPSLLLWRPLNFGRRKCDIDVTFRAKYFQVVSSLHFDLSFCAVVDL